ncbi:hypothetical protein V8B97DRAFT_1951212 [Scleroderma yunnanense]
MNFNVTDNPVLVAPRPVRVTPVYPHISRSSHLRLASVAHDTERLVIPEENENIEEHKSPSRIPSTDKEPCSSRASPLSSLPSEALEEFLSILRPTIFQPTSPILRSRRNAAVSLPAFGVQLRSRTKLDVTPSKGDHCSVNLADDNDTAKHTPTCSPEPFNENFTANWDSPCSELTSRWHAQVLASPVSRMHTRNPFPRYASQDVMLTGFVPSHPSPTMSSAPVSPAAVPLPLPSPDELLGML